MASRKHVKKANSQNVNRDVVILKVCIRFAMQIDANSNATYKLTVNTDSNVGVFVYLRLK